MKKISVIVPIYNTSKYLEKCLDSLINQTYKDLEIILVDDGSSDRSYKICQYYFLQDKRIKVFHKENGGVSSARNLGLENATGDYISFIDSDDELELDMYYHLVSLFDNEYVDIVHCGYKRLNEDGKVLKEVSGTGLKLIQNSNEAIYDMLNGIHFVGGLWNKLYKRSILKNIHFNESLKNNEDILFNVLAFQKANIIIYHDVTKYLYYEHSSSVCNTLNQEKQYQDSITVYQFLVDNCLDDDMKELYKIFLFKSLLNYYRFRLFNQLSNDSLFLKKTFSNLNKKSLEMNINYYLLIYFPFIYKVIYKIYDLIRKPNWDVKG